MTRGGGGGGALKTEERLVVGSEVKDASGMDTAGI